MATHILADKVTKRGTALITVALEAVPLSANWSLTDRVGNIVNNRLNIPVTAASVITVQLEGDDTDLEPQYISQARYFTLQTTANFPESIGPVVTQVVFEIDDTIDPITP